MNRGMSLIEILIAVAIFAVLGIITTSAIALTLKGSKKGESSLKVRENVSYALGVIERQLRNADSIDIDTCTSTLVNYIDGSGNGGSFSCVGDYIASVSARLTSDEVTVTNCSIVCEAGVSGNPPAVNISLEASDAQSTGVEGSSITVSTKVYLRTY